MVPQFIPISQYLKHSGSIVQPQLQYFPIHLRNKDFSLRAHINFIRFSSFPTILQSIRAKGVRK